ncbi:hypothetical protein QR685DRAFT_342950 [Neurospora intermedia]|uniref:Uncharacterized protein n=1 Tax=Neurospora intermedia TaxID=5142 RepID=A0ABR3D752_NEUIN
MLPGYPPVTVRTGNHDMSNLGFFVRALRRAEYLFQTTDSASPPLLKRRRGRPEAPIALRSFAALHQHMHSDRMPAELTYLVTIPRLFPARRCLVRVRCRCQQPPAQKRFGRPPAGHCGSPLALSTFLKREKKPPLFQESTQSSYWWVSGIHWAEPFTGLGTAQSPLCALPRPHHI